MIGFTPGLFKHKTSHNTVLSVRDRWVENVGICVCKYRLLGSGVVAVEGAGQMLGDGLEVGYQNG